jgi:hypothetical protein
MVKFIGPILFLFCPLHVLGQEHDLRQVISTVFYNPKVFDKIFFEYKGDSITFMEGYPKGMKGAFMLPDSSLQKRIPDLLELVGTNHAREKYFMTMTFVLDSRGDIYITSNIMDMAILAFVNFDRISITQNHANIQFHTTSFPESPGTKENHYKVHCDLIKRKKGWKVSDLNVEPIECCTSLWPSFDKR